ncbi:FAD-dependent monooxygenase [Streptomyces sp. YIM 98790]|uniref:FAD-dependent monooxygenase n=1 Tax=Streptomyces sp. YIM 98790 TaxID=2689077 RepID=UPI0028BD3269|nr:FAD-dependent monooxygenase [Streptomyces sp. YIM 98790]
MTGQDTGTGVVIAGAGPVGLLLAGELRLGGVPVTVLERLAEPTGESRASTLHARTMELLDQRGLVGALGTPPRAARGHFGGIPLDMTLPAPFPGLWKVPQSRTEAVLARWAAGLGACIRRDHELTGITEHRGGVAVRAASPGGPLTLRARYLVGCDGERTTVGRLAGFDYTGEEADKELLRADVAGLDIPDRRFERHPRGLAIASRGPGGITRIMLHEYGTAPRSRTGEPGFAELAAAWARITGEDISHGTAVWLNAFDNTRRQATRYRRGRILLAGDAAHQQMPVGGQALNLGLQDAANLGWKLAAELKGWGAPRLLDTYHDERHAVGRRVLTNIAAQALLLLGGPRADPARQVFGELLATPTARSHLAAAIGGLDIRYEAGQGGHPLLGSRLPYHLLETGAGPVTTLELLRPGRGVLLDLTGSPALSTVAAPWADRVRTVPAESAAAPALGFTAALIRPDGHLVWADGSAAELRGALHTWFGRPARG